MQNKTAQLMIQEVVDGKDAKKVVRVAIGEDSPNPEPDVGKDDLNDRARKFLDDKAKKTES